jgi:fructose-bisphosphate aldolase class II
MPLVNMRDMLMHAYQNGYAVGAFDLVSLDFLQAIVDAAERCKAPVILSLAESHFEHYNFAWLMPAVVAAAWRARVPMAVHLDHGTSLESAIRAIGLGCNGVMVDASSSPFEENVARTRAVVQMARSCGVPVEGELGYVAGVEGEDAEKHPGEVVYTSPEEARRYVEKTEVDCLAVSIGTVHGRMRGVPQLDFERLAAINERLGIPLVIHGGTGLTDEQFRQLIAHGVSKINYYTALSDAAAARIRHNLESHPGAGYTALLGGVQQAIRAEVERCITLWGSRGRAQEVLARACLWHEVEHLIVYNVDPALEDAKVTAMMARGREVLGAIPGVRRVFTGRTIDAGSAYRYCWLIRFASPLVRDSYRDHPDHVTFADTLFRPVAQDRITIDFECGESLS